MIKHLLAVAAVSLPLATLAGQNPPATNAPATNTSVNAKQFNGATGNTAVDGNKHRSNKKTLKAYCEKQAARQNLGSKQKTQAAIANCEKS